MKADRSPAHSRRRAALILGLLGVLIALGALLFPFAASAYYLERAGGLLDVASPSPAAYRAAEDALRRALTWEPRNAQAYRLLAAAYERQGDRAAAAAAWAQVVALLPRNPIGYWQLASLCEQLPADSLAGIGGQPCGRDEDSRQATVRHLWQEAGLSAAAFVDSGNSFRQDKAWDRAQIAYRRALALDPESAPAWFGLGELYLARGEPQVALDAYARAVAPGTDVAVTALAYNRRGKILSDVRRWAEASADLAQAAALQPGNGENHYLYGWALYKAGGDVDQARSELALAARLLPDNPWPHLRLADLYAAGGDIATMLSETEQAVTLRPALAPGWTMHGRALRLAGRPAESEQALRRAVELDPSQPDAYTELGYLLAQLGRLDEAIQAYLQAAELAPRDVRVLLGLGAAYRAGGQTEQAVATYRQVLELEPGNAAASQALQELVPR